LVPFFPILQNKTKNNNNIINKKEIQKRQITLFEGKKAE